VSACLAVLGPCCPTFVGPSGALRRTVWRLRPGAVLCLWPRGRLNTGPSDWSCRTVRCPTPDRSTCAASAGFGASCVLSRGRFQGDLLCECLLRFVGCVASQWPTLNAVLEGYVFGRDFWFRPFTPLWSLKLILQILSNVRCNYFNSSFIMVFWIIYMQI